MNLYSVTFTTILGETNTILVDASSEDDVEAIFADDSSTIDDIVLVCLCAYVT